MNEYRERERDWPCFHPAIARIFPEFCRLVRSSTRYHATALKHDQCDFHLIMLPKNLKTKKYMKMTRFLTLDKRLYVGGVDGDEVCSHPLAGRASIQPG